jgi:hypothetical protein
MIRALAVALALIAGGAVAADAPVATATTTLVSPSPSQQTYVLSRGMLTLGEARFSLAPSGAAGCWRYEYSAHPSGLAALFIGTLSERSDFCMEDGHLRSRHFEFHRSDRKKDDFSVDFDWKAGTARSSRNLAVPLADGTTDRLAMQIEIQRWVIARNGQPGPDELAVTKVEANKPRTYRFRIVAREPVTVPAGRFDAVRVERVDNPKRTVRFWLAPNLGYAAVRVENVDDGDEQFSMALKSSS